MKLNFAFKKNISGFKPNVHWKMILTSAFILFLCAVGYNIYLYTYAQTQINAVASSDAATSTPANLSTLASPETIQGYFQVYKEREEKYNNILKALSAGVKVVETSVVATTSTSSSVVASSTNQ